MSDQHYLTIDGKRVPVRLSSEVDTWSIESDMYPKPKADMTLHRLHAGIYGALVGIGISAVILDWSSLAVMVIISLTFTIMQLMPKR